MKTTQQFTPLDTSKTVTTIVLENTEELSQLCSILCVFCASGDALKTSILTECILHAPIDLLETTFIEKIKDKPRKLALKILIDIRKHRETQLNSNNPQQ